MGAWELADDVCLSTATMDRTLAASGSIEPNSPLGECNYTSCVVDILATDGHQSACVGASCRVQHTGRSNFGPHFMELCGFIVPSRSQEETEKEINHSAQEQKLNSSNQTAVD